jgi:hypothetical protein
MYPATCSVTGPRLGYRSTCIWQAELLSIQNEWEYQ